MIRENYLSREAWSRPAWAWRIGCIVTWPRDVVRGTWRLIRGDAKDGRPYRDYLVAYWVPRPLWVASVAASVAWRARRADRTDGKAG